MKFLRSIRFRLIVLYWLLSNALLLVVIGIMYYRLYRGFDKISYARLREEAHEFAVGGYSTREALVQFAKKDVEEANDALGHPWLFFCACDTTGKEIARSDNIPQGRMLATPEGLEEAKSTGKCTEIVKHVSKYPLLCRSTPMTLADGTPCIAQLAISQWREVKSIENLRENIYIVVIAFASVSLLLAFVLVTWSFNPVKRITRTAESITAHDLSRRIPLSGVGDEMDRLACAFNDMIERLEDSFRRAKQFSADASHELKTPIAAMRSQIELALESERSAQDYHQVLNSCLEEISTLRAIVDGLLLLARHDNVNADPPREPVQLREIIEDVCDIGRNMADERDLSFVSRGLDADVPILANRRNIERLFLNLVENAVRYNTPGGSVSVALRCEGEAAVVEVTDTGLGIGAEELPLIFGRFYRGKQARSQIEGVGLGLSLCKAIVEEHRGTISARSELGKGSTFTVTLPVASGAQRAAG